MEHQNEYHPDQQQQLGYHPVSSHHDPSNSEHVTNTLTISQDILKDPVKVLYLFQCFQEAQDDKLCDISFDIGKIDLNTNRLLPHQVVTLGFFLSKSRRKWKKLDMYGYHIGDHGINLLHHYLCGGGTTKQQMILSVMTSL